MQQLRLPTYPIKLTNEGGKVKVWCPIRKKNLAYTPEEHVRQHFVNFLINDKMVPRQWMQNELNITVGLTSKRCDSVIFDSKGSPLAIVEYKAPEVRITQATFNQIARYTTALAVPFLIVSNGIDHYCMAVSKSGEVKFLQHIPSYDEMITMAARR